MYATYRGPCPELVTGLRLMASGKWGSSLQISYGPQVQDRY